MTVGTDITEIAKQLGGVERESAITLKLVLNMQQDLNNLTRRTAVAAGGGGGLAGVLTALAAYIATNGGP